MANQSSLKRLEYVEGQDLSPELTDAMLEQAKALLDLQDFELGEMSFQIKALDVQKGKLMLGAIAHIEQFPGG